MSELTVVAPAGGEIIGDAPDRRVEILSDHDPLHATWSRFGPRRDGASPHIHRDHTDLFYILEGELTVKLGPDGTETALPAGTLARVPPLVVHGFRNATDAEVRYLNFHAPGQGFAAYMRGLRDGTGVDFDQHDPPADGGRPVSEAAVGGDGTVAEVAGARIALLADTEAVAIAEIAAEPGAAPPEQHVHRGHAESLYVLDGAVTVASGDREVRAEAGSWVQLPAGVPHALAFGEPARLLSLHAPNGGFGPFVRALAETPDEQTAIERAGFDQHGASS